VGTKATKISKIWEQKSRNKISKNLGTKVKKWEKNLGTKIWKQKLQKIGNKNYKNMGTKITKI
jgi:hypothetical protein